MTKGKVIVAPSILAADLARLGDEVVSIEEAGADWIHVDVMDGSYVPPITFGDNAVTAVKRSCRLPADVHLMVEHPETHIAAFKAAGAARLTVHQEACPELQKTLTQIREAGLLCGASVDPATPVELLFEHLESCNLVLIMTVKSGWGGQPFIPETLGKIERLRNEIERRGLETLIEVDGGINPSTAAQCVRAGASVLVAGSYVFKAKDRRLAIRSLRVNE